MVRKGLCLSCIEKFGLGHVCKNKQFQLMLVEEDGLEVEQGGPNEGEEGGLI